MNVKRGLVVAIFACIISGCGKSTSESKHTITFDKQGGLGGTDSVIATLGESMPTATAPTKSGFEFVGYYDAVIDGTQYYGVTMNSLKNWDKKNNSTFYARWEEEYVGNELRFELTSDSLGYAVYATSKDINEIGIPAAYRGLPVTKIGDYAFQECVDLASISISNNIITIGDYAFDECISLTSITIPNSVTRIGYSSFDKCYSLETITIPSSVTSIRASFFDTVIWNNASRNSVVYIDNWAVGYKGDKHLVTNIDVKEGTRGISSGAFRDCSMLTKITIPNSVTVIDDFAFIYCRSIVSINIPSSVVIIGSGAFYECNSLKTINIPSDVVSIGDDVFNSCHSLTSITIPSSVTEIGSGVFYGCRSLTTISVKGHSAKPSGWSDDWKLECSATVIWDA